MKKLLFLLSLVPLMLFSQKTFDNGTVKHGSRGRILLNTTYQRIALSEVQLSASDLRNYLQRDRNKNSYEVQGKYGRTWYMSTTYTGNISNGFPYLNDSEGLERDIAPLYTIIGDMTRFANINEFKEWYNEYLSLEKREFMYRTPLDSMESVSPFFLKYKGEYYFKPYWNRYSKKRTRSIYNWLFPTSTVLAWYYDTSLVFIMSDTVNGESYIRVYYAPTVEDFIKDLCTDDYITYKSKCLELDKKVILYWISGIPTFDLKDLGMTGIIRECRLRYSEPTMFYYYKVTDKGLIKLKLP